MHCKSVTTDILTEANKMKKSLQRLTRVCTVWVETWYADGENICSDRHWWYYSWHICAHFLAFISLVAQQLDMKSDIISAENYINLIMITSRKICYSYFLEIYRISVLLYLYFLIKLTDLLLPTRKYREKSGESVRTAVTGVRDIQRYISSLNHMHRYIPCGTAYVEMATKLQRN
jgi:hypothetical protein